MTRSISLALIVALMSVGGFFGTRTAVAQVYDEGLYDEQSAYGAQELGYGYGEDWTAGGYGYGEGVGAGYGEGVGAGYGAGYGNGYGTGDFGYGFGFGNGYGYNTYESGLWETDEYGAYYGDYGWETDAGWFNTWYGESDDWW